MSAIAESRRSLSIRDRWGDRRDQPGERAPSRMGTFRARPAPPGRCRGDCRSRASGSAISRRSGRTRPSGGSRLAIRTRGRLVSRSAGSRRGRFDGASLRRCTRPPRARRATGRSARGDRAPLVDDRSGMWRGARCRARCASPNRHGERPARRSCASRRCACRSRAFRRGGRCLSAGVLLVPRRFAVPAGVGLLSARHAVGRARARPGPGSCRALVSTRHCLLAGLCEGACAPGGDLREPGPTGRRGGAAPAGAFEPRSGGSVASCRRADRTSRGSKRPRHSSTPHGPGSKSFLGDTCSLSRTMPRSSTPAAATIAGGR